MSAGEVEDSTASFGRDRQELLGAAVTRRLRSPRVRGPLVVLGFAALLAVVFYRQLFDGFTFPWDFVGSYSASPAFAAAAIGHGHFYSWTPYVASGFPVGVDPQSGYLFPVWWVLGALRVAPTLAAVTDVQIVHVLFGATGVVAFARVRRLGWSWAVLAGVAYLFFGGFYGESEHADIFRGFAYLPWLLWALTPPVGQQRWRRLVAVPLLAWLIASGAYPGQVASFGIVGVVYLALAVGFEARDQWRGFLLPLALVGIASGAVAAAVLAPYLHAQSAHQLVRVAQPTFQVRAAESLSFRDFLGLYLNNFAWTYDGTVTSWAVGIPVLVGVACARLACLRRQAPLVICGALGLALAMTPKVGPIGHAMVSLKSLFPSRFPASDYKAIVAIALIVVAADSWSEIAAGSYRPRVGPVLISAAVIAGAILAPSTDGPPTRALWLVIVVAVATVLLALARPPARVVVGALVLLVCIDSAREIIDYRLGPVSPWAATPADAADYRARDTYVRLLPVMLEHPPASRPARVGPFASLTQYPTGNNPDAAGWAGDGYHLIDYGGTVEQPLWDAQHNAQLRAKLLAPWHAYTFPCTRVGCTSGGVRLPAPHTWKVASTITTSSYGPDGIVYHVHASQPELMVENELAVAGWRTSSPRVRLVASGLPLRTWRLSPGNYTFTATYAQPAAHEQLAAALVALLAWLGSLIVVFGRRRRRPSTAPAPS